MAKERELTKYIVTLVGIWHLLDKKKESPSSDFGRSVNFFDHIPLRRVVS